MNIQFLDWLWILFKTFWLQLERYWRGMVLAVFFGIPSALLVVNAFKGGGNILSVLAIFLSLGLLAFAVFVIFHPRVIGALTVAAAVSAGLNPKTLTPEELKKLSGPVFGYAFLFVLYWIAVPLTVVWIFSLGTNALMLMFLGLLAGIYAIGTGAKSDVIPQIGLALVSGLIVYYLVGAVPFTTSYPKLPYLASAITMLITFFGIKPFLGIALFALTPKKLGGLVLGLIFLSLVVLGMWWFFSPQSFEEKQKKWFEEHQSAGTLLGEVVKKKERSAPSDSAKRAEEARMANTVEIPFKRVDLDGCEEIGSGFPIKPGFKKPVEKKNLAPGDYVITTEGSTDQRGEGMARSFRSDGSIMDLDGHRAWITYSDNILISDAPYGIVTIQVGRGAIQELGAGKRFRLTKSQTVVRLDLNMFQTKEFYEETFIHPWNENNFILGHLYKCDQK